MPAHQEYFIEATAILAFESLGADFHISELLGYYFKV